MSLSTVQGNFLALNSDEATMGRHSGLFWAMMISSNFFGNIFAYSLFRDLEDIDTETRHLVGSVLLSVTAVGTGLLLALRPVPPTVVASNDQEAREKAEEQAQPKSSPVSDGTEARKTVTFNHEPEKNTTSKVVSPLGALIASGRLFVSRNMLLLSLAFLYSGLHLNLWSAVYGTCLGFTTRQGIAK